MRLAPDAFDWALFADPWDAEAGAALVGAAARAVRPDPQRTVDEWADAERIVAKESGSPTPGPWSTERVPYLRDIMRCLSFAHPCRRVTLRKSAQVGGSECGLNLLGQIMAEQAAPCLVVVPTLADQKTYNTYKLAPMIDATASVRRRVLDQVSRDGDGSTNYLKKFSGGTVELVAAAASRGLQMKSARVVIFEEISEYPWDTEGRGDPVSQGVARTIAYTGREKILDCSTPYLAKQCRVTTLYEASSKGRYFVPCPHCKREQPLELKGLSWPAGQPEKAGFVCGGCGTLLANHERKGMIARGKWVHERPELVDRHAGFAINTLYSPFVSWPELARLYDDAFGADGTPAKQRAFTQQYLGEAYEDRFDLPSEEILFARRETWPEGRIPPGVLFLTGAVDVQGDRLEWAVWGFDRHFTSWRVDGGVIEGDPHFLPVWHALDKLVRSTWRDVYGRIVAPEIWGVDAGFLSPQVYAFCRGREEGMPGSPPVLALDGRAKWGEPALGVPATRDVDVSGRKVGSVRLWPVGTWDIKAEIAHALRLTELGPADGVWPTGAIRLSTALNLDRIKQLTAEVCKATEGRTGREVREWVKVRSRNEEFDTAVYARALARHQSATLSDEQWRALEAMRLAPPPGVAIGSDQADLAELWTPGLRAAAVAAQAELEAREAAAEAARRQHEEAAPPANAAPWGGFGAAW